VRPEIQQIAERRCGLGIPGTDVASGVQLDFEIRRGLIANAHDEAQRRNQTDDLGPGLIRRIELPDTTNRP
jgi:hypothetical protein